MGLIGLYPLVDLANLAMSVALIALCAWIYIRCDTRFSFLFLTKVAFFSPFLHVNVVEKNSNSTYYFRFSGNMSDLGLVIDFVAEAVWEYVSIFSPNYF